VSLSLGVRPRSEADRLALCRALVRAPRRVGLRWADDGWAALHLALAGRTVCRQGAWDRGPVDALLARFDLPPTTDEPPECWLAEDLTLSWEGLPGEPGPPAWASLPPVEGPLTSILVCTYNRAHLLQEALASARAQTRPREIIVVDDGSDDGTAALLAPLHGVDGIRVIRQDNTGKPGALRTALAAARGAYLLVLDDDDVLLPGALHALGASLDRDPSLGAVFGDTAIVRDVVTDVVGHRPSLRLPPDRMAHACLIQVPCMPGACLIRRAAHDAAGEYDASLVRGQDMDLFLRLARVAPMRALPLTTFLWREHGGLRGKAGDRWARRDRDEHDRRFQAQVAPVFRRRWVERSAHDRLEGHAWAVGLRLRGLGREARRELARWKGPYTPTEAHLRGEAGAPTRPREPRESVLVIDDGDAGALEETLARHGDGRSVRVCLEVHREPLNHLRLWWPGEYRAQEIPPDWLERSAHVRLSSAPEWAPPGLSPLQHWPAIAEVPSTSGLLALAAVHGWEEPSRTRPGLRWTPHPLARAARAARAALQAGDGRRAMAAILPACEAWPAWTGGWRLAADAFGLLGLEAEALVCLGRAA
jgi:glycosyltransferase involved in cell wall biosynthesis